jgi:hypothetical protein
MATYTCDTCKLTAPDACGCPKCGGPTFLDGGPEQLLYRKLARAKAWDNRVARVLLVVLACLWGLQIFFTLEGGALVAWLAGDGDGTVWLGVASLGAALAVTIPLAVRFAGTRDGWRAAIGGDPTPE